MKIDFRKSLRTWSLPFFKVLANNDTGTASGHVSGIVIPTSLRPIFPILTDNTTSSNPTIDQKINVELYDENKFLERVISRYQYQTWGGTRSPESRITDQLGALRNLAQGGDILIIQKSLLRNDLYRFILIRKASSGFQNISHLIGARRWGELYIGRDALQPVKESKISTKILFIWVKKYKNLENFSLNLTSDVKFTYDEKTNEVISDTQRPLPNDFLPSRIDDVIALIGKNGSGKSNALELICNIAKGAKSSIFSDFLVITKLNDGRRYSGFYKFKDKAAPRGRLIDFKAHSGSINPLTVMFFSNVYDERRNNFDSNVIDLSMNSAAVVKNRPESRWDIAFLKQIDFLDSSYVEALGLIHPHAAQITVNVFNSKMGIRDAGIRSESLDKLYAMLRRRPSDMQARQIKNRFISLTRYLYIVGFLNTINLTKFDHTLESRLRTLDIEIAKVVSSGISTENILIELLVCLEKHCKNIEFLTSIEHKIFRHPNESDGQLLRAQFEFLSQLPLLVESLDISHQEEGIRTRAQESFIVNHTPNSRKFLKMFGRTMSFIRFVSLDWVGLSSGQKAYLNLFSKLTAALRTLTNDSVLLCIDEGDLYLHPKWQAEFLYRLLSVLSAVSNVRIQLVLTSHSPLLVSDLPRQNLQILNWDSVAEENFETFGANIYDLYAGPLFLGELSTGLFAHLKLFELSQIAEKDKMTRAEHKLIESYFPIIGDEILRFKLEEDVVKKNRNGQT